jgi:hypothetical protein
MLIKSAASHRQTLSHNVVSSTNKQVNPKLYTWSKIMPTSTPTNKTRIATAKQ